MLLRNIYIGISFKSTMHEKIKDALDNGITLEILKFCDGKNTLSDIVKDTGLTYKTVSLQLDKLKEIGLIHLKKEEIGLKKVVPYINNEYEAEVKRELKNVNLHEEKLKEELEKEGRQEFYIKFLDRLSKNRFLDENEIVRGISEKLENIPKYGPLIIYSKMAKFHRQRVELTRKGSLFLKEKLKDKK